MCSNTDIDCKKNIIRFFKLHAYSLLLRVIYGLYLGIYVEAKVMATIFFYDTSPVGKCDIYRRKDKVLTTCVDTMPADIPHNTYTL